ncbi:hypothetical protein NI26_15375 [Curtobacterium sp. MR_MD2014]|nr:hypothetical protein NI26_15375 [Curtobacterium sp. MR_MD2014]
MLLVYRSVARVAPSKCGTGSFVAFGWCGRALVRLARARPQARRTTELRGATCFRWCGVTTDRAAASAAAGRPASAADRLAGRPAGRPVGRPGYGTGTVGGTAAGAVAVGRSMSRQDPPSSGDSVTIV